MTAPRGCGIAPGMAIYVGISQTVDHLMNIAKPDKYAPFRHKAALTTIHCPCDDVVIASTIAEFQAAGGEVKAEAHLDLASLPRDEMFGLIPTTPATSRSAAVNAGLLMFVQHKVCHAGRRARAREWVGGGGGGAGCTVVVGVGRVPT